MAVPWEELQAHLAGRVCLVGVGNPERGDDGLGVRLAEALRARGHPDVIVAGRSPERCAGRLGGGDFRTVLFLDAVEMGAAPGAAVFLTGGDLAIRYPQLSTHTLSLGTLARLIEAQGATRVFLIGVQPARVADAAGLSEPVRATLTVLEDLLAETLPTAALASAQSGERP